MNKNPSIFLKTIRSGIILACVIETIVVCGVAVIIHHLFTSTSMKSMPAYQSDVVLQDISQSEAVRGDSVKSGQGKASTRYSDAKNRHVLQNIDRPIKADVQNDSLRANLCALSVASGGIITILLVNYFLFRIVVPPFRKMSSYVKDISEGEGDLTRQHDIDRNDEIGDLAHHFNLFIRKLGGVFQKISRNSEVLSITSSNHKEFSVKMSSGADKLAEIANAVSSASEQISMTINTMSSSTEEVSVSITAVSSTIGQLSENINSLTVVIEQMRGAMNGIADHVQDSAAISEQAMKMAQKAAETINTFGDSAQKIGKVTHSIRRIAEQTDLLALNATIQAAGAGEAGKSFAVVANEIKALAVRSALEADEINNRISSFQGNTEDAVEAVNYLKNVIVKVSASDAYVTAAVDQHKQKTTHTSENIRQVNSGMDSVAKNMSEIAHVILEISRNTAEIAKTAAEVASNIRRVNRAAENTNSDAGQIENTALELSEIAGLLQKSVADFKVKTVNREEEATKKECMSKCKEAADLVKKIGVQATLDKIQDKYGPFVWKDSYVWCYNFVQDFTAAHPIIPEHKGKKQSDVKDINGKMFIAECIKLAKTKNEGWINYMYPKAGETRPSVKILYFYRVPGEELFMGAGVYRT